MNWANYESRERLIVGGILLLIATGATIWWWPWVSGVFRGPIKVTEEELREMDDLPSLPSTYISFNTTEVVDTGLGVKKGTIWKGKYLLVRVKERWAMAYTAPDHRGGKLIGHLSGFDSLGSQFDAKAVEQIRGQATGPLTSFYIQAGDDQELEVWMFIAVMGVVGILGAGMCIAGTIQLIRNRSTTSQ